MPERTKKKKNSEKMSSTEHGAAFAVYGWELNLKTFADMYVPVQPPPGSKPASFPARNTRSVGDAGVELKRFFTTTLSEPLDPRLVVVLTAQTDDGQELSDFRLFVCHTPVLTQTGQSNDADGSFEMAPMRIPLTALNAALANWIQQPISLPQQLERFVKGGNEPALFIHTFYVRWMPEIVYQNGAWRDGSIHLHDGGNVQQIAPTFFVFQNGNWQEIQLSN